MGAVRDLLRQAATTLAIEANGVSDNPLIFADTDEALSGGNFHAEPVAFAADMIAMALCEIGSIAERRLAMHVDPADRKSIGSGKRVSVRVDLGGRHLIKKKKNNKSKRL